jgi:hypothetical protein
MDALCVLDESPFHSADWAFLDVKAGQFFGLLVGEDDSLSGLLGFWLLGLLRFERVSQLCSEELELLLGVDRLGLGEGLVVKAD